MSLLNHLQLLGSKTLVQLLRNLGHIEGRSPNVAEYIANTIGDAVPTLWLIIHRDFGCLSIVCSFLMMLCFGVDI